jgi:hypothetical protein
MKAVREDGCWHRWPGRVLVKQHSSPYRLEMRRVGWLSWLLRMPSPRSWADRGGAL